MNVLSEDIKISTAITPTAGAANTTAITGTTLDMAGWDGVLILVRMGTITSGAVTSIKAMQGTTTSPTTDLEGTSQTIADTATDKHFYIDLFRPSKRYVALYVSRGTQNAVVASASYIQYRSNSPLPNSTHGTGVTGEAFVTPAEGTA